MTRVKLLILGAIALLSVYIIGLGQRAFVLLGDPSPLAKTFGALLVVFPLLGVWSIFQEVSFGVRCERLGQRLTDEGYPAPSLSLRPSGKAVPEEASKAVVELMESARQSPSDWRVWLRLAEVLDAAGNRKDARKAARTAIRLSR